MYLTILTLISPTVMNPATSALHGARNSTTWPDDPRAWIRPDDFSPTTYLSLGNASNGYSEFNLTELEQDSSDFRRQMLLSRYQFYSWDVARMCYFLQTVHRNAIIDMRRYFRRRLLYKATMEYEIGYLVHEIIFRYRTLLELYHYIYVHYVVKGVDKNYMPPTLMFYMYTNVLEQAKTIVHLCHMLQEVEPKYRGLKVSGVFDDYSMAGDGRDPSKVKYNRSAVDEAQAAYEAYLQKLRREERRKRKQRKEYKKNVLGLGKSTTRGRATRKKSKWPLDYGWSIEDW